MILHFVTAFLLQEINASQEKSQRKSNSPSQTGKVPEGRICTGQRILDTKSQKLDVKKLNK